MARRRQPGDVRTVPLPIERQLQRLAKIERNLHLPSGFLRSLRDEGDDWSFVIKVAALLETAVTDALLRKLGWPWLAEDVTNMPLVRKLQWAHKADLIPKGALPFSNQLSRLRNKLAHQIRRAAGFSIRGYVDKLNETDQRALVDVPSSFVRGIRVAAIPAADRHGIWRLAIELIVRLEDTEEGTQSELEREIREWRVEVNKLLKATDEDPDSS